MKGMSDKCLVEAMEIIKNLEKKYPIETKNEIEVVILNSSMTTNILFSALAIWSLKFVPETEIESFAKSISNALIKCMKGAIQK